MTLNGQPNLEKILNKDEFHPHYLEDISPFPLPISAIIVSYNRCPHQEPAANPLMWSINSLLEQKSCNLSEIVIVDDASTDYTQAHIQKIGRTSKVPVRYLQNSANRGSPESRNRALKEAREDIVFFMDDDCVLAPYGLFGLAESFEHLSKTVPVGVVLPPIYFRATVPKTILPANQMSRLNPSKGHMTSDFDKFPQEAYHFLTGDEYQKAPKQNENILPPTPIQNLMGVFMAEKAVVQGCGGFPTHFTWKNSYTEESELSLRLQESGRQSFFLYDPKFHAVHFKYGYQNGAVLEGSDWKQKGLCLQDMAQQSNQTIQGTGNRVSPEDWAYSKIISLYTLFGLRSAEGAAIWERKSYQSFVEDNDASFYSYPKLALADREKRQELWQRAINEGNELIYQLQEKQVRAM